MRCSGIVSVGRLGEARKGWSRLIRAYESLRSLVPDAPDLVIGGRGTFGGRDQNVLAASSARSNIKVLKDVPNSKLVDILQHGSVFVQASYEEGLGIAGLEAMAVCRRGFRPAAPWSSVTVLRAPKPIKIR
jgi:glycosyltransferase involved in cell wall biosynthesis